MNLVVDIDDTHGLEGCLPGMILFLLCHLKVLLLQLLGLAQIEAHLGLGTVATAIAALTRYRLDQAHIDCRDLAGFTCGIGCLISHLGIRLLIKLSKVHRWDPF